MPLIEDAEFAPIEEAAEPKAPENEAGEFDPRHREDFVGLLYLGANQRKFSIAGHTFVIRTLRTEDVLAIGLATKEYLGTVARDKAYSCAVVGTVLVSVDGRPLETPFREEAAAENVQHRMGIVGTWSPFTIDAIYSEYLVLDNKINDMFEALGKVSG